MVERESYARIRWSMPREPKSWRWFIHGNGRPAVGYAWTRWGARRAARRYIAIEREMRDG